MWERSLCVLVKEAGRQGGNLGCRVREQGGGGGVRTRAWPTASRGLPDNQGSSLAGPAMRPSWCVCTCMGKGVLELDEAAVQLVTVR